MTENVVRLSVVTLVLGGGMLVATAQEPRAAKVKPIPTESSAAAVKEIFRAHCLECHGGSATRAGVKILDRNALVDKNAAIVPKRPDESPLFQLIASAEEPFMPPKSRPRLNPEAVDAVRRWIADGAPAFPADEPVPAEKDKDKALQDVVGVDYVLKSILEDVRRLKRDDKPYVRYFSINHILTGGATKEALELYREALAKAINHLSYESELVRPRSVEASNTVFAIDLRKLGWHKQPFQKLKPVWDAAGRLKGYASAGTSEINLFDLALLDYPYGTLYEDSETYDKLVEEFLAPAGQVRPVPYVRADWFVSIVTQPPLYEDFLQLPFELAELEKRLGVDAQANLDDYRARRAGMIVSGVSRNNRVVERHPARNSAYYWKSFDFRSSKGPENMFKDPLHFSASGGEMIFSLPNGLQAYYVCDAKGVRLELAPTDIVTDKFAEDKTVRNGLACMRCHDNGMKDFEDTVRPAVERLPGSPGFDKRAVLQLYPEKAEMDELVKQDKKRFTDALERLLGKKPKTEPLVPVSQRFLDGELPLTTASAELGLPDPSGLKSLFRLPQFAGLGLMSLASEGVVRRDMWEDYYDQVVRQLGLGVPVVPLDGVTRRDVQPQPSSLAVELATNKKSNVFEPGEQLEIVVTNKSGKDIHIELVGTSAKGKKVLLAPHTTVVKAGQRYRWGPIKIQSGLGKEQVTVFACDTVFPAGELLRGQDVADRFVHPFYKLERTGKRFGLQFDPARMVKKTIEFETR
jgi:serine/threonine-protein kinase